MPIDRAGISITIQVKAVSTASGAAIKHHRASKGYPFQGEANEVQTVPVRLVFGR